MKCQARCLTPLTITPLRQVHPLHLIELRRLPGIMTLAAKDNHGADSTTIAAPHVSVASVAEFAFATWMHSDAGNNLRSQDDNCPSHLNTHHRMHWPLNPFFTSQDLQRKTRPQLPQTRAIACSADDGNGGRRRSPFRRIVQELFSQLSHQLQLLCFVLFKDMIVQGLNAFSNLCLYPAPPGRGSERTLGEGAWLTYLRLSG